MRKQKNIKAESLKLVRIVAKEAQQKVEGGQRDAGIALYKAIAGLRSHPRYAFKARKALTALGVNGEELATIA